MSQVRTRTLHRAVAAAAAVALAAGGVVTLTATSASAAPGSVSAGSATWGFKQSFRSYLGSPANDNGAGKNDGATITLAQGAAFTGSTTSAGLPTRNTTAYTWPLGSGTSYDPVTRTGSVRLGGKVTFTLPKHWINDVTISNPTIVLDGDCAGTGVLKVDYVRNVWGVNAEAGDSMTAADVGTGTQVAVATLTGVPSPVVTTTSGGQTDTFSNIVTTLTTAGSSALGLSSFYPGNTVLDPLSFSVEHAAIAQTGSTTNVASTSVAYGKARSAAVAVVGVGLCGGTVAVKEGARSLGTAALKNGSAAVALPATLSVGKHTLTASYPGSAALLGSSKTFTLTVTKATTKSSAKLAKKSVKVGKKGKLTATVTAAGLVVTGKVTVKEGKKTLKTATLKTGKATITLPKLKKGKHKLVVSYAGSGVAGASTSSKVTLTVKK